MKGDKYFNIIDLDDFIMLSNDAIEREDIEEQRKLSGIFSADYLINEKRLSKEMRQRYKDLDERDNFYGKLNFMLHEELGIYRSLSVDEDTTFIDVVTMLRELSMGDWVLKLEFRAEIDRFIEINKDKLDDNQIKFLERKRFLLQKAALESIMDIDID